MAKIYDFCVDIYAKCLNRFLLCFLRHIYIERNRFLPFFQYRDDTFLPTFSKKMTLSKTDSHMTGV